MKQQLFMAKDPFFFHTGQKAKNLQEFLEIAKNLDTENFRIHVNEDKNDFAAWIRYSIGNNLLAKRISELNSKEEIIKSINNYMGIKSIPGIPPFAKNH
jgi:hypothetical protein